MTPSNAGQELPGLNVAAWEQLCGRMSEPAELHAERIAALARYLQLPAPYPRAEEWRHTSPELFSFADVMLAPSSRVAEDVEPGPWDEDFDAIIEVRDDAVAIKDRTGRVAAGDLDVLPLATAAERFPALWAGPANVGMSQRRKFVALNHAFWTTGFLVRVRAGAPVCRVLLRWRFAEAGRLYLPRLKVVVEPLAQLSLVERFQSLAGVSGAAGKCAVLLVVGAHDFHVAADAALERVALHEWGGATACVAEDWAYVAARGRVDWVTAVLGGRAVKLVAGCEVAGPEATAHLNGLYFADGEQRVDQRTEQRHAASDTTSYLLYKGAVRDRSHAVYQGLINACPGAIRVDAYQMNRNLILNEGAHADSLPGLEIDADDLKCSHGSAIGSLDPEQIFFLRARGLDEAAARRLLVAGFFDEVIAKLGYARIQEHLRACVREKMEKCVLEDVGHAVSLGGHGLTTVAAGARA